MYCSLLQIKRNENKHQHYTAVLMNISFDHKYANDQYDSFFFPLFSFYLPSIKKDRHDSTLSQIYHKYQNITT